MAKFVIPTMWIVSLVGTLSAQIPVPAFDVTSVKPNKSVDAPSRLGFQPGGFTATNETLRRVIGEAYGPLQPLPGFQILGGPDWMDTDRFDIVAKVEGTPSPVARQAMLRTLLTDRFKLTVHGETRALPIYWLVMARNDGTLGPQLRRSDVDCAALDAARRRGEPPAPALPGPVPACALRFGVGQLTAKGMTMAQLAGMALSRFVNRVVVDRTGLSGGFDWTLEWTPDQAPSGRAAAVESQTNDPNHPSLFTAVQEQLGLKLTSEKGPVQVLVIDAVERPVAD
jgi:uncharacterized protein (TIGR03435 family)